MTVEVMAHCSHHSQVERKDFPVLWGAPGRCLCSPSLLSQFRGPGSDSQGGPTLGPQAHEPFLSENTRIFRVRPSLLLDQNRSVVLTGIPDMLTDVPGSSQGSGSSGSRNRCAGFHGSRGN